MSTARGLRDVRGRGPALLAAATALMLCASGDATAGEADAKPREAELDLRLEQTGIIVRDAYRDLPPMGRHGAMGVNLERAGFRVSSQRLGDLYVRAGLVFEKPRLIKKGFRAFDFAFARQDGDGSFPESQAEAYAFFVEAVAHSAILVRASRYGDRFRKKVRRYGRRTEQAAKHMVKRRAWAGFKERNPSYTHTGYSMGAALGLTGSLSRNGRLVRKGRKAIRQALDNQWRDGVNPELGGYDVRYQMAGLVYAERYRVYFPAGKLARRIERMVGRGLRWMSDRVAANGYIRWRGSTRACRELNSLGNLKTPGYSFAVRGFAYWGAFEDQRDLVDRARRIDRYGRAVDGSTCGPRQRVSDADREAGGFRSAGRERPVGTLEAHETNDLIE